MEKVKHQQDITDSKIMEKTEEDQDITEPKVMEKIEEQEDITQPKVMEKTQQEKIVPIDKCTIYGRSIIILLLICMVITLVALSMFFIVSIEPMSTVDRVEGAMMFLSAAAVVLFAIIVIFKDMIIYDSK